MLTFEDLVSSSLLPPCQQCWMEITKFTKWIISQEKINIYIVQNESAEWWNQMINFCNENHLDFLPLTQNSLCFLPGAVQLAFSIGKNFVMMMIRKIIIIISLQYHHCHEYFCWIMTFIWNKMMILFVYHLKVLLFFFLTERKAFFGGTGDEVGWKKKDKCYCEHVPILL